MRNEIFDEPKLVIYVSHDQLISELPENFAVLSLNWQFQFPRSLSQLHKLVLIRINTISWRMLKYWLKYERINNLTIISFERINSSWNIKY